MFKRLLTGNLQVFKSYAKMPEKSAVVLLANGSEEIEFTVSVDVLRRAGVS